MLAMHGGKEEMGSAISAWESWSNADSCSALSALVQSRLSSKEFD